ncbi:OsmC family protein [Pseudoalteromonas sp. BDTF-M6]|uniref:OsmC family protein n=1 Tax=Pseudoalteromonas sp. BDTF-M6 TaxID=2796132 RepID=UPI001BAEE379|nr:OsmC family protein [Pseudoalteromonas sp. BDTF-M6]MBS3798340.1 OsmC family protein [Pseudoalteromonas sp. BDTF-M6]
MSIKLTKTADGQYRQQVQIGPHRLFADARIDTQSDSAPDPHDIYDSALAACKAITLLMYAQRAGIPLTDVAVDITRDASEERQGRYHLHLDLMLGGELDAAQREKLAQIAEKCPIHKLMTQIETILTTDCK